MTDPAHPRDDLREQCVEAVARRLAEQWKPERHGQLCPIYTRRRLNPAIDYCDCWRLADAREDAGRAVNVVLPLVASWIDARTDRLGMSKSAVEAIRAAVRQP